MFVYKANEEDLTPLYTTENINTSAPGSVSDIDMLSEDSFDMVPPSHTDDLQVSTSKYLHLLISVTSF